MASKAVGAVVLMVLIAAASPRYLIAQAPRQATPPTYDDLVRTGFDLLGAGEADKAYVAALSAAAIDNARFQAYALGAMAAHAKGDTATALALVEKALNRAPAGRKSGLETLKNEIDLAPRRGFNALVKVVEEADRAQGPQERAARLRELLEMSALYVAQYPAKAEVWLLRAAAALELNYPIIGWAAGQHLIQSPLGRTTEQKVRGVIVQLERRGWLAAVPPEPKAFSTPEEARAGARAGDAEAALFDDVPGSRDNWSYEQFQRWYLPAAKQGHPQAYLRLGYVDMWGARSAYFRKPDARPVKPNTAIKWFRLAALHGDLEAIRAIAHAYVRGLGVAADYREAIRTYTIAAERGDVWSQLRLAELLAAAPDSQQRNGREALRWAEAAFAKGRETAPAYTPWALQVAAAAHAELSDWGRAAQTQQQAIDTEIVVSKGYGLYAPDLRDYRARLEMYKKQRRWTLPLAGPAGGFCLGVSDEISSKCNFAMTSAGALAPTVGKPEAVAPTTARRDSVSSGSGATPRRPESKPPRSLSKPASTTAKPRPPNATPLTVRIATSATGLVNVRAKPSTSSAIVGRVKAGETYAVSEVSAGWYRLKATKGWVAGRYVTVEGKR
jgi:hypothetical protein